jgi:hypothetical protein
VVGLLVRRVVYAQCHIALSKFIDALDACNSHLSVGNSRAYKTYTHKQKQPTHVNT